MKIDYKVCYFSEDLKIHGGSASFCGEFGGEEELARACFLDFDILPFRSSVISKTHGCYFNLKQIIFYLKAGLLLSSQGILFC